MAPIDSRAAEPDYDALARFRHLIRRFLIFSEEAARKEGLRPRQHQLLLAVKGLPEDGLPTIGALAWQLQLKHHTVGELVDRMAAIGLLRRIRHELDQREVLIAVTAKGEAVLRKLSLAHREELRRLAPQILPALTDLFHPNQKGFAPCPTPPPSSLRRKGTRPTSLASAISRRRQGSSRSASSRSRSAP
ncbi:MAG TPA: MarR family transcriptional regulator [Planctomycetota bacterium]|nr:MarR family transcriptional regulator [Planctomycetota bacterium]